MERRYLIKLNLERLETQNQNVPMDNDSLLVFSANGSKKILTV